ncbi:MAG TPA: HAMP domain-containing sensor histidine kinase [Puia sp.]|nr:HAMP domain-containing sensor histidine kinase [Puia sp.]
MKLLNKTIRSYILYSSCTLVLSVPLFYFVIQRIVSRNIDEGLIAQKEQLVAKLDRIIPLNPFDWLQEFEPDIRLTPLQEFRQYDILYTTTLFDKRTDKIIPYRVLESNVLVRGIPYNIQLRSSLLNNDDLIRSIVLVQTLLILLVGAGLLLINRALSKKTWKPFYRTLQILNDYKIERGEQLDFGKTDIDEFASLNNTITTLTSRNRQAYQAQKEFTENASHEMQTPLAVIQGKTELLMQTTPLTEEQAELISDLTAAAQRMNRLNKSLLLLSRIENQQFTETEPVDLAAMLRHVLTQYSESIHQKQLQVLVNDSTAVTLQINKTLLETMLGNLLSNAIRHNIPGGKIDIHLGTTSLLIQNTGRSTALDSEKLFRRFQKQGGDPDSTGLGLEIVKKICDLNGYRIRYSFENGLHCFLISF